MHRDKRVDSDQTVQNVASDLGQPYLPLILHFSKTSIDSIIDLFKLLGKDLIRFMLREVNLPKA